MKESISKEIITEIREELFRLQDTKYRDFQSKLIPGTDPGSFIGVRTPELRKMAKQLVKRPDAEEFLNDLPHTYFDENQLHAFVISEMKDFEACLKAVNRFLPYVDNWATCDQMSPKVFKKHKNELVEPIRQWIAGETAGAEPAGGIKAGGTAAAEPAGEIKAAGTAAAKTYIVRFGVGMLMEHFLGEAFDPAYPEMVAAIRSDEYYVRMMAAWYFATALAKQYDAVIPYIEERRLDPWTHNKTIQKAVESYRISAEQKDYLRSLRVKKG